MFSVKSNLLILLSQSWSIVDSLGSNLSQDVQNLNTGFGALLSGSKEAGT